jgi:hypothetical protein
MPPPNRNDSQKRQVTRRRDVTNMPPGLKAHVVDAIFSRTIRCRICGVNVPRRDFEGHAISHQRGGNEAA